MRKTFLFSLIIFLLSFISFNSAQASEPKIKIEVAAKTVQMTPNVPRTPIKYARIRSSSLRQLIADTEVTYIERVYESVPIGQGAVEEQVVTDTYYLVFNEGVNVASLIDDFQGATGVESASL